VLFLAPYGYGSYVFAVFLLCLPVLVLALGVMAVHRREERMRLLDVGRATERESRPAEA
jgi:heme exporter protein D